ncbi:MAG: hypothetical protein HKO53_15905 [Gemmatimonadetes bacterium]|nr:hypothetical protein [Gemmatimonadota bacterium]
MQESYSPPGNLRLPYLVGGLLALVLVGVLGLGGAGGKDEWLSNGPLTASHALFGDECTTCHTAGEGTSDAKCSTCHEKRGDHPGAYSLDTHFLYRSDEADRSSPLSDQFTCGTCHREHQGRSAPITAVADQSCNRCHTQGSFEDDHVEFAFVSEEIPDQDNLRFPHILHVREIMDQEELEDVELTCLSCHNGQPDGTGFEAISFEQHCSDCHLTSSTRTPALAVATAANPVGVQTLDQIASSGGAGRLWADYTNPNEFQLQGNQLRKRPLYHADPWVLDNLSRLRSAMYDGGGLEELLRVSADVPLSERRLLYDEAITTLRDQIRALRDEPSAQVQRELEGLEELLAQVERRLADPLTPLNDARFRVGPADRRDGVTDEQFAAYESLIGDLTAACQECHVVEEATIKRVRADQATLNRAEFSHRAHVTHAQCLDCHTAIPVRDFLNSTEDPEPEMDHAGIQNLPSIESCRSCHGTSMASNDCTSCHSFHPDKSQWSNLLRYAHP